MRCLVTGGAGFLGSLVCERLINEGHDVLCVDNLLTGRLENIQHLASAGKSFLFVKDDVRSFWTVETIGEIWNLASPASPPQYQSDPIGTMMTNVVGTERMLQLAVKNNAKFFQASTSEVYGDPEVHPQPESYRGSVNPIGIRACYDEGKRAAESLCYDYKRIQSVDVRVARIFNTYGPFMDPKDGRVVSNFIVNALLGNPLEVFGDGGQTRSFCYRDDLVDGFFMMMRANSEFDGPMNIGNPNEFTILELANIVMEATNSISEIIYKPLPEDDPKQRRPDIQQFQSKVGWKPTIELSDGVRRTVKYFESAIRSGMHL